MDDLEPGSTSRLEMPEVSVVIPTNGRWNLLSRALAAALEQERTAMEVIVVDDGSIRPYPPGITSQLDDRRVTLVRTEQRTGVAAARNRGLKRAIAEWVAFLDDDDIWAPVKLRAQLDLARRSDADFVYSSAVVLDDQLAVIAIEPAPTPERLRKEIRTHSAIPAGQSNVVARTELLRDVGGFDESLLRAEDWELWIRLVATGKGTACQDVHVGYVHHQNSMHLVETDLRAEMERIVRTYSRSRAERRQALILGARWRAYAHRRAGRRGLAAREYLRAGVKYLAPLMVARSAGVLMREAGLSPSTPPVRPALDIHWIQRYIPSGQSSSLHPSA